MKFLHVIFAALIATFLCSCTTLKPWEKEYLASPLMRTTFEPDHERFSRHVFDSKEASSVGYGAGGGGCGCN